MGQEALQAERDMTLAQECAECGHKDRTRQLPDSFMQRRREGPRRREKEKPKDFEKNSVCVSGAKRWKGRLETNNLV